MHFHQALLFAKAVTIVGSNGRFLSDHVRVVQSELEAMMQGPRREAITMMFLVVANVPLLYFLNEDWFHTLIFTTPGKIALAICAAIILFALTQIMKLSKPIEYGGDGA